MAERRPFLLRIDASVLEALQRWANDDLRSLNGQIEFVLRHALRASGRAARALEPPASSGQADPGAERDPDAPGGRP